MHRHYDNPFDAIIEGERKVASGEIDDYVIVNGPCLEPGAEHVRTNYGKPSHRYVMRDGRMICQMHGRDCVEH